MHANARGHRRAATQLMAWLILAHLLTMHLPGGFHPSGMDPLMSAASVDTVPGSVTDAAPPIGAHAMACDGGSCMESDRPVSADTLVLALMLLAVALVVPVVGRRSAALLSVRPPPYTPARSDTRLRSPVVLLI